MIILRVFQRLLLAGLAGPVLLMSGCTESPAGPSSYAPFSQTDVRTGTGPGATRGDVLAVHYTGWLYDGSAADKKGAQFDSSRGTAPFLFVLGQGQVIAGWDQGLVGIQVGGVRQLVIPPSLAYGPSRTGIIPPNATLVFDIELLRIGLDEVAP